MASQLPFHQAFSIYILSLIKKGISRQYSDNGITVSAVRYTGEIVVLDRRTNTGAIFSAEHELLRGICTIDTAVSLVKPADMSAEDHARYSGMLSKKL